MNLLPAFTATKRHDVSALINRVHCCDFFDLCEALPDKSVDMICPDLPYGVHEAKWDSIIPVKPMWEQFRRIIKPRCAIVLTATMRFAIDLINGAPDLFKYEWVWSKNIGTDFLNAKNKPLRAHELILVFSDGTTANKSLSRMVYNPQMRGGFKVWSKFDYSESRTRSDFGMRGRKAFSEDKLRVGSTERYPTTILEFDCVNGVNNEHPNQKPVALFEYLIRAYTQPGDVVFDPTCGSGTTAIAARNEKRRFICGDQSPEYVAIANKRLDMPYTPRLFEDGAA